MLALYQQTELRVFADSIDWLFMIVAILTAGGVVLAMFLRSGRAPASAPVPGNADDEHHVGGARP
jgi:hypothetical protein